MTKDGRYEPHDYAYALMDVATWLRANATRIIGNDIRDMRRQDITISIEPCCVITINVNTEYMVFKNGSKTPVVMEHHERKTT